MNERTNNYYIVIPYHVYNNNELSSNAKLLYGYLSSVSSKTGINYSQNDQIQEDLTLSHQQTRRAIKELEDQELIYTKLFRNNFRKIFIPELMEAVKKRIEITIKKQEQKIIKDAKQHNKIIEPSWLDKYLQEIEDMG